MSKLTRKYGKSMSAFAVATLAGITSMGMAQAQSPEVIMAPIPEVSYEYGTGSQSMTFVTKENAGFNTIIESNTAKLWEEKVNPDRQERYDNGWIDEYLYNRDTIKDAEGPTFKYNYDINNFNDMALGVDTPTEEITADYVNEVMDVFIGSGIGLDMTIYFNNAHIENWSDIETIDAKFVNTYGGGGGSGGWNVNIFNDSGSNIGTLKADFISNGAPALWNFGTIGKFTGNVIANGSYSWSSRVYNNIWGSYGNAPQIANDGVIKEGIVNSNFINNIGYEIYDDFEYQEYFNNESFIGDSFYMLLPRTSAIVTSSNLTLGAEDGFTSHYSGNKSFVYTYEDKYDEDGSWIGNYWETGKKEDLTLVEENNDAVFMMPYSSDEMIDLTLQAKTGGKLVMEDKINGINYNLKVTGDETGSVYLNNRVNAAGYDKENDIITSLDKGIVDVSLEKTNLILGRSADVLDGHNLTLNSGALSMLNGEIGQMSLNQLNVAGDTKFYGDVDLANSQMDRVTADEYSGDADIVVAGLNLLSDAKTDTTEILFADYELKDNVRSEVTTTENNLFQSTAYSPIFKYDVKYSEKEDGGYFEFSKHVAPQGGGSAPSTPSVESFNPAVLGSSSTATVGATATMNQAFNYAFQHSSDHMNIPYLERISMRDRNKYALSITGDATDMGRFSPLYQPSQEEASVWVKPYATFETVGLKNGPKVHNNTYGTLIGFDTEMQQLRRGWDRVFTGYIGYNGASQRYSGIDSTQNGGLLGGTMTLYKGNFFNATTVSVGASVANNQTMYGNEDFAMLLSGIGNKTGYNFEFKEGKLILQPSMLMSYTFVNTFDYTNAAGVRIDNKPLHALQLAPGVKVIGNLKGGWQPYASVQMVWNLMGESNATANGVKLPEMSIKPYVQYGVGVQKRIKDHFTAYGQAMVQNGGRNGVSLTAGFRWALGHDNCKYEKTQRHPEVKTEGSLTSKEILRSAQNDRGKSIRHSELDSESINANKTLTPTLSQGEGATGSKKILKQMTPEQKMVHGGKYYNTSRTAKTGSLRQY